MRRGRGRGEGDRVNIEEKEVSEDRNCQSGTNALVHHL